MNKILSWTIGSFFRTIGRIIAYLAIGLFIAFILSNSKLPKISNTFTDIFFMKVNASEYQTLEIDWKDDNGSSLPQYYGQYYSYSTFVDYARKYNTYAAIPTGTKGLLVTIDFRGIQTGSTSYCTDWDDQGTNSPYCSEWITDSQHAVSFIAWYNNNSSYSSCYFLDNRINTIDNAYGIILATIYCPVATNYTNFNGVSFYGTIPGYGTSTASTYFVGLERHIFFDVDGISSVISNQNNNTQSIINNQNQNNQSIINNQQANTNRTIETLTDSNTTQTEGEASSFFSNFSTSDNGGLSSIITAPLSAIQSLTNASCSPLVLPLPYINENLTLPCMRTIYETHFGAFMILYDTITIGIISYWILVRIFNMVKDFKNPDHDEIEVVDL